jgi:hypothetical protein
MTAPTIWIITPVYLDVPSFLILRQRLRAELMSLSAYAESEIRFVIAEDTAGLDPAIAQVAALDDVIVIQPPFNLGHQRAIVYAARKAAPLMDEDDFVVTMDADGEDSPQDVRRLLAALNESSSRGVVLAVRSSREESLAFKLFYLCFRTLFRLLTGTVVRSGNFAAFRGRVAGTVLWHPHFDLCYSSTLTSLDLAIEEVPCARSTRYEGESRMSFSKLVRHGLSMLMPFLDRIAIRALIVFTAIVIACVATGIAVLAVKLGTNDSVPGWATALLVGLVISSLVAIGNFVVLFAVYTQTQGLSLARLEEHGDGGAPDRGLDPDRTFSRLR